MEGARDAAHLRRLNLERVLAAAMAREGEFTRAELIEATGLSALTVGSLATSLIRADLLTDLGPVRRVAGAVRVTWSSTGGTGSLPPSSWPHLDTPRGSRPAR